MSIRITNLIFSLAVIFNIVIGLAIRWLAQVFKNSHYDIAALFFIFFYLIVFVQFCITFYDMKGKHWMRVAVGCVVLLFLWCANIYAERTVDTRVRTSSSQGYIQATK